MNLKHGPKRCENIAKKLENDETLENSLTNKNDEKAQYLKSYNLVFIPEIISDKVEYMIKSLEINHEKTHEDNNDVEDSFSRKKQYKFKLNQENHLSLEVPFETNLGKRNIIERDNKLKGPSYSPLKVEKKIKTFKIYADENKENEIDS